MKQHINFIHSLAVMISLSVSPCRCALEPLPAPRPLSSAAANTLSQPPVKPELLFCCSAAAGNSTSVASRPVADLSPSPAAGRE